MYADDGVIYYSGNFNEANDIIERVNKDLANVSLWASRNGLLVNASKTQAIWVVSRPFMSRLTSSHLPYIVLNGVNITPCKSLQVLGITLDNTLLWRDQCNTTAKKSFGALARLRKCQGYLPQRTKLVLIKSLVFSYFEYCGGIFLNLSKEFVLKLSRCKNAALRCATGTKLFDHITPVYRDKEILTYEARRDFLAICILMSILRTNLRSYLAKHFSFKSINPDESGSLGRCSLDLEIDKFELEYLGGS